MINGYGDEFFDLRPFCFLVIAFMLTMFSIFYASWFSPNITGFQIEEQTTTEPKNPPPESVISQIYESVTIVSDNADYSSNILETVVTDPDIPNMELIRLQDELKAIIDSSADTYKDSSKVIADYDSDLLDSYQDSMVRDISKIQKGINAIDARLAKPIEVIVEEQQDYLEWELEHEKIIEGSVGLADLYFEEVIPGDSLDGLSPIDEDCIERECVPVDSCAPLSYLIAVDTEAVDFGQSGYDKTTGDVCVIEESEVYIRSPSLSPIVELFKVTQKRDDVIFTLHFSEVDSDVNKEPANLNFNAVVINKKEKGISPTFNFLTSNSYSKLEDQIYLLANELITFSLIEEKEFGMNSFGSLSEQQKEEIIKQSKPIPWVLWIVLFFMVVGFFIFCRISLPHYKKLIYSGKRALGRKDYNLAIQNYNEIVKNYPNDFHSKQEVLDYLIMLKRKIGKIDLDFQDKDSFPRIKKDMVFGAFSDFSKVSKLISHALHDLIKSPKLVKARMNLIAEEYSKLNSRDKARLATNYESLVYSLFR